MEGMLFDSRLVSDAYYEDDVQLYMYILMRVYRTA